MTDFEKMYEGSYYTIVGCGGDLEEWFAGYNEMMSNNGIGTVPTDSFVVFHGSEMNEYYHLTGDNRYPDELTFIAFPLDGLNISKLSMFKIQMQDRWFDDIVENNRRREEEEN